MHTPEFLGKDRQPNNDELSTSIRPPGGDSLKIWRETGRGLLCENKLYGPRQVDVDAQDMKDGLLDGVLSRVFNEVMAQPPESFGPPTELARAAFRRARENFQRNVDLRDEFTSRFRISAGDNQLLRVTLPKDTSRLEFLRQGQELFSQLHDGQLAVEPLSLQWWDDDRDFLFKESRDRSIAVYGLVNGTDAISLPEQLEILKKLGNVALPSQADLAVAHVANLVATEKDLFLGRVVRCKGGALTYTPAGLEIYPIDKAAGFPNLAISAQILEDTVT